MRKPLDTGADLPPAIAWSLPLLLVLPFLLMQVFLAPDQLHRILDGERGLMENVTVLLAVVGFYLALSVVAANRRGGAAPHRGRMVWMAIFGLGFLYIAGEEASWGQHWFEIETPDWLADVNYQQETNVHNLHIQIDKAPKTVLMIAMILGGLVRPIWLRCRSGSPAARGRFAWIWPTDVVVPAAAALLLLWVYSRMVPGLDRHRVGGSEHRELMQVGVLLLYTLSLRRRFVPWGRRQAAPGTVRNVPA